MVGPLWMSPRRKHYRLGVGGTQPSKYWGHLLDPQEPDR